MLVPSMLDGAAGEGADGLKLKLAQGQRKQPDRDAHIRAGSSREPGQNRPTLSQRYYGMADEPKPEGWLEGEIELTAFALAHPDCDVRAVLRGFAELVTADRAAALAQRTAERLYHQLSCPAFNTTRGV